MAIGQPTNTISQRQLFAPPTPLLTDASLETLNALALELADELRKVRHLSLDTLPYVPITDIHVDGLPPKASAVYFLSHPERGILYIGKATDLRGRFQARWHYAEQIWLPGHAQLEKALALGNVRLSWFRCEHTETIEYLFIRSIRPAWNIQLNGDKNQPPRRGKRPVRIDPEDD